MDYTCRACGEYFFATQEIDEQEARYNPRTYEPPPIYCPECGNDEVEPA